MWQGVPNFPSGDSRTVPANVLHPVTDPTLMWVWEPGCPHPPITPAPLGGLSPTRTQQALGCLSHFRS